MLNRNVKSFGEYWAELENNHHYIIVSSEYDRTFYCPSEEAATALARILNDKNKTIHKLRKELKNAEKRERELELSLEKLTIKPTWEILRECDDKMEHVAYVNLEELAFVFCKKHKDCHYVQLPILGCLNELDDAMDNIITQSSDCYENIGVEYDS